MSFKYNPHLIPSNFYDYVTPEIQEKVAKSYSQDYGEDLGMSPSQAQKLFSDMIDDLKFRVEEKIPKFETVPKKFSIFNLFRKPKPQTTYIYTVENNFNDEYLSYYIDLFRDLVYEIGEQCTFCHGYGFDYDAKSRLFDTIFNSDSKNKCNLPDDDIAFPPFGFLELDEIKKQLSALPVNNLEELNIKWDVEFWSAIECVVNDKNFTQEIKAMKFGKEAFLKSLILDEKIIQGVLENKSVIQFFKNSNLGDYDQEIEGFLSDEYNKIYVTAYNLWLIEAYSKQKNLVVFVS